MTTRALALCALCAAGVGAARGPPRVERLHWASGATPSTAFPRRVLVGGAVAAALPLRRALAAQRYVPARYSLVPQGSIAEKERRLAEVRRSLGAASDDEADPYLVGERAQLEFDLERLAENREAVLRIRSGVAKGGAYVQRLTLRVPDLAAARTFWVDGLKMSELRAPRSPLDGSSSVVVGYGREGLGFDDGAKFALELVQASAAEGAAQPAPAGAPPAAELAYVQLRVPNVRLSSLSAAGGRIESAYGWVQVVSPHGLCARVLTAKRRDPFELVALRVPDVDAAARYYARAFGMRPVPAPAAPKLAKDSGLLGTGLLARQYEDQDPFSPPPVYGSVLMAPGCCAAEDGVGVLLVPMQAAGLPVGVRPAPAGREPLLHVASGAPSASALEAAGAVADGALGAVARDPAGVRIAVDPTEAVEALVR